MNVMLLSVIAGVITPLFVPSIKSSASGTKARGVICSVPAVKVPSVSCSVTFVRAVVPPFVTVRI